MTGPRPLPHPAEPCVLGAALLTASMAAAGVIAFLVGATIAKRLWPES